MRHSILEATRQYFIKKGDRVSLKEVGDAVGIKKQSLYNYYDSKEDLIYDVVIKEVDRYFSTKMNECKNIDITNSKSLMKKIFFSIVEYLSKDDNYKFWRYITTLESENLRVRIKNHIHYKETMFLDMMIDIFNKGVEEGFLNPINNRDLLRLYLVMIHGTVSSILFYKPYVDPEDFANSVWRAYIGGINGQKS